LSATALPAALTYLSQEQEITMTIGRIFHLIHMTGNLPELEAWYDDVFSVRRGFLDHHHLESERRDASLVVLADVVLEPLSPAFSVEGWENYPLGRYLQRFGNHWHSIAWYVEDDVDLWYRLHDNGIRMLGPAGTVSQPPGEEPRPIFTHPADTMAQLEFLATRTRMVDLDPRLKPGYDPMWWRDNHPLGLIEMAYTTVLVKSLDQAIHVYADVLGGTMLGKSSSMLTGTDDAYVSVGESTIQLSTPNTADSLAAEDFDKVGQTHHAVSFRVQDLDQAEAYLESKAIRTATRDETTLLCDPATTHGALFRFTTDNPRDQG
jgi:hypothetical protein